MSKIFQEYFHRDPDNVTCECCGNDFSVEEGDYQSLISYFINDDPNFEIRDNVLILEVGQ